MHSQTADSAGFYKSPVKISRSNADSVKSFFNTPESVAIYYFASRIRRDSLWLKTLVAEPEKTQRFKDQIKRKEDWIFVSFKLVKRINYSENRVFIKAFMEFEINGDIQSGKDDLEIILTEGKWLISGI